MRPNLLLVHWHDVGRRLGAYGVSDVATPNLDRLAAEGIRFDRGYAAAPECSAAHSALFTGRYPHSTGMLGHLHLGWGYEPDERTLPMLLRDAGYRTALVGVQAESLDPATLGYHEVCAPLGASSVASDEESVTDAALSWLAEHAAGDRPFLLTVGHPGARRPWPTERVTPETPDGVVVPDGLPDNAWIRSGLATFSTLVRAADRELGRLLDRLDALGLTDTTWVVFTTDHGTPFPRAKGTLYEAGIEIALIMRLPAGWPRPPGAEERLISHVDIVPTLLERIGVTQPAGLHGVSHLPWLRGDPQAPRRREIFAEKTFAEAYDPIRAVRTARWKYIRSYEPRPWLVLPADVEASPMRYGFGDDHLRPRPMEELYDLVEDPEERVNLADDAGCTGIRADLAGRLLRWRQRSSDPLLLGPVPRRTVPGYADSP